jgi:hypothetical protein
VKFSRVAGITLSSECEVRCTSRRSRATGSCVRVMDPVVRVSGLVVLRKRRNPERVRERARARARARAYELRRLENVLAAGVIAAQERDRAAKMRMGGVSCSQLGGFGFCWCWCRKEGKSASWAVEARNPKLRVSESGNKGDKLRWAETSCNGLPFIPHA